MKHGAYSRQNSQASKHDAVRSGSPVRRTNPRGRRSICLGLKAIAEKRFAEARGLLDRVQESKEIGLAEIYRTRGQTEFYAGNYVGAVKWYEKALEFGPVQHRDHQRDRPRLCLQCQVQES